MGLGWLAGKGKELWAVVYNAVLCGEVSEHVRKMSVENGSATTTMTTMTTTTATLTCYEIQ